MELVSKGHQIPFKKILGLRLKNFFSLCFFTFNGTFRWCLNVVQVWVFLLFVWCLNIVWALLGCRFSCCSNGVQVQLLLTIQMVFRCNFSLLFKQCLGCFFGCLNVCVCMCVCLATWVFNCYICKLCIAWRELEESLNILLVILLSYLTISNQVPPPTSNLSLLLKWVKVGKNELNNVWTIFKNYFLKIWKIMGKLYVKKIVLIFKINFYTFKVATTKFSWKFTMFQKSFYMFKALKKSMWRSGFFVSNSFSLIKCSPTCFNFFVNFNIFHKKGSMCSKQ